MPKYHRALFIYNGNAGSNGMEQKLTQTLPILSQAIKELTIIQTESIEHAKQTCVKFSGEIELLIILGGDGTLNACVNAIATLKDRPVIAILPGGTSNDFSRMLQIPQNLQQAAHTIVNGKVVNIDLGKAGDRYFLNFWGIGLVAQTSQNIDEEQKTNLGILSYFMSTVRTVNQAEAFQYEIITEENKYSGEAVMIIVLNGRFIGTREMPIPSIHPNDGMFDALIVKNSTLLTFRELLSMKNPNTDVEQLTELDHFQTKKLKISTNTGKEIDMDGEIAGTTPEEISVVPGHMQMIHGSGMW
ncbi:diacylglycerol/lipid kinase family protein [Virgibacillus ainsalahensis]